MIRTTAPRSLTRAKWLRLSLQSRPPDLAWIPIVLAAAVLRLWQIARSPFTIDSAGIYTIAQDAVAHHALPATGIVSSIWTFCQPASIYLYLPFALMRDPVFGAAATAIANVAAVALTYFFARRYLGLGPAIIGSLLFAVSGWPVEYSRFIWQQNLLPALVLWCVLLLAAPLTGGRTRWLAWILPVWGVMLQLHPSTLAFGGLIVLVWVLAPASVRLKDALIGGAGLALVFVPTLLWEISSGFFDLHAVLAYAHHPSTLDLAAVHQFLAVASLPPWSPAMYQALPVKILIYALVAGALLYLAARVLRPLLLVTRRGESTRDAGRLGGLLRAAIRWMRAPEQARWRIELLVLGWPGLIVLSQLRHNSPIFPHYMIATFPAQFLAVGILVASAVRPLGQALRKASERQQVLALAPGALMVIVTVLLIFAQLASTPALHPQSDQYPLTAEKDGLQRARQLVSQDAIALVVIQPDFFTRESVRYMLDNGYQLGAPTQVIEPDSCVLGPGPRGGAVLYLMSGPDSLSERYIARLPGVRDAFAGTPASAFFRAYIVDSSLLTAHLDRLGSSAASTPLGEQVELAHSWRASMAATAPMLALDYTLIAPVSSPGFDRAYRAQVSLLDGLGSVIKSGQAQCAADAWVAGQQAYLLFSGLTADAIDRSATLRVVTALVSYTIPDVTFASVPLASAYALTTVHYYLPAPATTVLQPSPCGRQVVCAGGGVLVSLAP